VVVAGGHGAFEPRRLADCDMTPWLGRGAHVTLRRSDMATSLDRVWACGDVTAFEGKLKLIATGYAEAAIAVSQAVRRIRPDMVLQPGYSTHAGAPGAVEGEP
jgi:pyruvate/2-oxoglutarate dehydrogenase complex dihydrolipoamide dehydrogenase (E3) component